VANSTTAPSRGGSITSTPPRPTTLTTAGTRIDTRRELGCTNTATVDEISLNGAPVVDGTAQDKDLAPLSMSVAEAQLVPPAGRIEFLVSAPALGQKLYLVSHAVDTGCTGDSVPERRLGVLTALPYTADAAQQAQVPPRTTSPNMFAGLLTRKTDRKRVIAFAEYPRPGDEDQTDFYSAERRPGYVGVLRVTPQGGAGPAGTALETATHAHTPQDMNGMH
jgi:hypothetical protein